jgi:hypothetical protein
MKMEEHERAVDWFCKNTLASGRKSKLGAFKTNKPKHRTLQ